MTYNIALPPAAKKSEDNTEDHIKNTSSDEKDGPQFNNLYIIIVDNIIINYYNLL